MTPAELLPHIYPELRRLAAAKLAAERPGYTLDATALVHEAFLKLGGEQSFASRTNYLLAAVANPAPFRISHFHCAFSPPNTLLRAEGRVQ